MTRALVLFYAGRNNAARDSAQTAHERALRTGDARLVGRAAEVLGTALSWSDTPWEEVERFLRSRLESDLGPRSQARVLSGLGRCLWMRGDFAGGRSMMHAALRRYEDLGQRTLAASHWMTTAHLEWAAGDLDGYERDSRRCWDELGDLGEEGFRSTAGTQLADALIQLGRLEEAERILEETERITSPDDYVTRWAALGDRARIAALRGDASTAADLVAASVAAADRGDSSVHSASARIVAAEAYRDLGLLDEARRFVAEAVHLAERKNSLAIAARARAVLQPARQE